MGQKQFRNRQYTQKLYNKVGISDVGNDGLPNKYVGYKWPVTREKNFAGSILTSYIKINPRWLKNLNVKNKVVGTKKENIKKNYSQPKKALLGKGQKTKCHKFKNKRKEN